MIRPLACLLGALLLSIGGVADLSAAAGPPSATPMQAAVQVSDDTVYVPLYITDDAPILVVYDSTLDTLMLRPTAPPPSRTASTSEGASSGLKEGISVAGLVIDRTHSVIGRDFQDAFHDHWQEPKDVSNFTIRITERPLPQFGSQIRVSVGETPVFQAQLRPEYERIQAAAQRAAARARYYLDEFYEPREVY